MYYLLLFFAVIGMATVAVFLFFCYKLYFSLPVFIVKPKIQQHLDKYYTGGLQISTIKKSYCPDLFHQFWGYQIDIQENKGTKVASINASKVNGNWHISSRSKKYDITPYKKKHTST